MVATAVILAACGESPTRTPSIEPISPTPTQQPTTSPSPIPPTPTPTPVPLAAQINGEPILLSTYQAELARYQAALEETGTDLATVEASERVLQDLIDQTLLAQAAAEAGYTVDDETLMARIQSLEDQMGGAEALSAWLEAQGYTADGFARDLRRAVAAAWMRDQIIGAVPETAEQVHARQILLYNSEDAQRVYNQLQSGADFTNLAQASDPQGAGDLGWFPRGYLTEPELEGLAFTLDLEEISPVVETRLGYHILQVLERQSDRPLDPDARLVLQAQALQAWLADRRTQSQIQVLLP